MAKKYSLKFWIIFWLAAIIFLTAWFVYWQTRSETSTKSNIFSLLPFENEKITELGALLKLGENFLKKDEKERAFLVLFQNNMELRPGGGYIGSFGILKIKNGEILELQTHDVSNFEGRIPDTIEPPYPMKSTLHINSWKLRDSNWSPDFPTNAKKAEEFYYLGKGSEKFEGVIGITANVLTSFLKVIGPIQVEGYPGTYDSENAIITLEYQVEKGYAQQGIEVGERKSVMNLLAAEIRKRLSNLGNTQKIELAKIILEDLKKKDIQLYFHDTNLQKKVAEAGWSGEVDQVWNKDYLMIVDANLGAYKSDYFVKRSLDYSVDLSLEKPEAILKITYKHTGQQIDWMTNNYTTYMRTYLPPGFWLNSYGELSNPQYATDLGKKYFGFLISVPIASERSFEFRYTLPAEIKNDYDLKIQKQAGVNDMPVSIQVTYPDRSQKDYKVTLNSDIILSELKNREK